MAYEKKRKAPPPTLEELRQYEAEYLATRKRQHGKERIKKEYASEEEEYKNLYNNWSSRESRKRKRALEKSQDKVFAATWGCMAEDADEYGIRPVDERKYIGCFKSGYIGDPVKVSYIKRMTGLSLKQINVLQQRTGYMPTPPVTDKVANDDEMRRYETGDIY